MGTGVSPKRIATGKYVIILFEMPLFATRLRRILIGWRSPYTHSFSCFSLELRSARISFPRSCISHFDTLITCEPLLFFLRKEVIQPHLPIRLPCYDFTPVIEPAFGSSLLAVGSLTSGISNSHGVTGGVYKTRERIHRDILIRDY